MNKMEEALQQKKKMQIWTIEVVHLKKVGNVNHLIILGHP